MPDPDFLNIAAHLPVMAQQQPDAPAVIVQGKESLSGTYSYTRFSARELDDESNRLARGLLQAGIGHGVRTVLMVKPSLEFFALTFALFKAGAVPVMVDPGMGIRNLGKCLAEAEPHAFIGIPRAHAARVVLRWAARTNRINVTVGLRLFWGGATLNQLRHDDPSFEMALTKPDEIAAILFTSGSTGVPKGVVYTHNIFEAQVRCLRDQYAIAPGERDLATFPLFALFGPALGMAAIVPNMDASKPGAADPRAIVAAIKDHKATNLFASPALIEKVGRFGVENEVRLPTLKRVISAGAPASPASLHRFKSLLSPAVSVFPSYGATEALPLCMIETQELLMDTAHETDEGKGICVGRSLGDATIKIIRISEEPIETWTDDLELPQGEIGEIAVCGSVVTQRYFNRPESTVQAKIESADGGPCWHRMGDLGYMDQVGRLWFCGRKAHRVEVEGETLFTIPCERIFDTHPKVKRTALVGVQDESKTVPVLCVEVDDEEDVVDFEYLKRELLDLGREHPQTEAITTLLRHPGFPVDVRHNAKIFREKLALWAEGQLR